MNCQSHEQFTLHIRLTWLRYGSAFRSASQACIPLPDSTSPAGSIGSPLRQWLANCDPRATTAITVAVAFSTYFCMYAFRKPFAAATYEGAVEEIGSETPGLDLTLQILVRRRKDAGLAF